MPVRFACQHCQKTLSIAQRKVGSLINCPNCGGSNTVPDEQVGATSVAMSVLARSEPRADAIPEVVVYDDVPELISRPAPATLSASTLGAGAAPAGAPSIAPPPEFRLPAVAPGQSIRTRSDAPADEAFLLISRRAVYAQGVLFCLVGAAAFLAGYLVGRSHARSPVEADAQAGPAADPVVVQGTVTYIPSAGAIAGDGGAAVLILPTGQRPDRKFAAPGLRGTDDTEPAAIAALPAIEAMGGAFSRANEDGAFQLAIPRPGNYFVLFISRHARRVRGRNLASKDISEMADYFQVAAEVVGSQQYAWSVQPLSGAQQTLSHEFGRDQR